MVRGSPSASASAHERPRGWAVAPRLLRGSAVSSAHPAKTILVVDDDRGFLDSLAAGLADVQGHAILTASDGDDAIALLASRPVDLVVTDLRMPGVSGFDLVGHLARHHPEVPAIVMTAFGTAEMEEEFDALGVRGYVEKPIDLGEL